MNRFEKNSLFYFLLFRFIIPIVILVVVLVIYSVGINSISSESVNRQYESLQSAIQRDILQCYAIEGTYPPNLTYLKEHYGLTYNEALFFVDYQTFGANIMPDVTIIEQ